MLKKLLLKNFRSYGELQLNFSSPWTVFTGSNGAGKSNLLEAVFFLSMLRSFRTTQPRELIRHGESTFMLSGRLERGIWQEELAISTGSGGERILERNGQSLRKSSAFINLMLPVAFVPEDVQIISGSASLRRRFVDMYMSMLDENYRHRLYCYNSALMQRNNALKRGLAAKSMAAAFEPVLSENAVYIMQRRRLFVSLLSQETMELLGGETESDFAISYRPNSQSASVEEYREKLAEEREREVKRGCTLSGPQLDEFVFLLNGQLMRSYASSGQRRKLAVYLKLAAYSILRKHQEGARTSLVVLADDVTGELDAVNRARFFDCVKTADQAFFTFTEPPEESIFQGAEIYGIKDSKAVMIRR